ncbi:unnamed protein product [Nezara viridula]|uniref:Uncharacterized protein n=1 Tax=Nezara viridula TaxID=85310 RepID=A0A9P0H063_NEZVI|nr:unnamed protein product [Nezara viridula]
MDKCKDKNGNVIEEKSLVLDRWGEHFDELWDKSEDEKNNAGVLIPNDTDIELPDIEDVTEAIYIKLNLYTSSLRSWKMKVVTQETNALIGKVPIKMSPCELLFDIAP